MRGEGDAEVEELVLSNAGVGPDLPGLVALCGG